MSGARQTIVWPVQPGSIRLAADVRHYLPEAVKSADRIGTYNICPRCGDYKSFKSRRCRACYKAAKAWTANGAPVVAHTPTTSHALSWRGGNGKTGEARPQPTRGFAVKCAEHRAWNCGECDT